MSLQDKDQRNMWEEMLDIIKSAKQEEVFIEKFPEISSYPVENENN